VGGWVKIIGFLRGDRNSVPALNFHKQVLIASGATSLALFLAIVFYLRQVSVAGSPQGYLYLEVGGTLLSFFYAAIALVRFRGTHDRTALILAFGFVLSGIIETVGCIGLNESLSSGALALSHIPMGWMVSRTLLAVLLLAAVAVERHMPTARQPSKETAAALLVVALAAYMTSAAFLAAPAAPIGSCSPRFVFVSTSRTTVTGRARPAFSIALSSSWPRSMLFAMHQPHFHGSFLTAHFFSRS